MNYDPTFHLTALSAQQREFDMVRADGPTYVQRPAGRLRTALTRGFSTRVDAPRVAHRHATA